MVNGNGAMSGVKELDESAIQRSAIEPQPKSPSPVSLGDTILWAIGGMADEFEPYGRNVQLRDRQLRNFITVESMFASALGIVASRNAAFSWTLEGPPRSVKRFQQVLEAADFGRGWVSLMIKVSVDLYSQDNGAFIEIVREADSPDSPVIGLNHLDAARCYHTGTPEWPVIYQNRLGEFKLFAWYQVLPLAEMPMTAELRYGQQMCALTRLLMAVQIIRNIAIYDYEKTGGRNTRAVHLVRGIAANSINEANDQQKVLLDSRGARRYSNPLIISGVDPNAEVGHDTIELASLPDNLDRDSANKWYIAQIALAFLEDYQTFAPLPGGNLGTSAQSEVLHAKARGKGPALFQKLITHGLNFVVFPDNIEFHFDEQDLSEEQLEAQVKLTRAQERSVRILAQEITPQAARVLAHDAGDLPQELLDMMGTQDSTTDVTVTDEANAEAENGPQNGNQPNNAQPNQPGPSVAPNAAQQPLIAGQRAQDDRAGPEATREEVETEITDLLDKTFARLGSRLNALNEDNYDGRAE